MKSKKLLRYIVAVILILFILAVPAFMAADCYYPYHYIKSCLYSNKESFDYIPNYLKNANIEENTHIRIDADSDHDEINSILSSLKEQYQNDSVYPVFSSIDVYFDSDGDFMFYIQARKEKLKNGDGINSPDIRCYELVYIDERYDGNSPIKEKEPFCENWYTWSKDTYSG